MDILSIEYGIRNSQTFKNSSSKTERQYVDFVVSGQSFGQIFGLPDLDLIGVFGWSDNRDYENKQIDEFLGFESPKLKTGRIPLYVCPECGDIGCGAITAKIEFSDNYVIWKDFAYENNHLELDLEDYMELGPFSFKKDDYFKIFEKLKQK